MKSFIEINFNNSFNRGSSSSKIRHNLEEVQVISASGGGGGSITGGNISNSVEASQIKQRTWLHDVVVGAVGTIIGAIAIYILGI